jgi:hypothetical protein
MEGPTRATGGHFQGVNIMEKPMLTLYSSSTAIPEFVLDGREFLKMTTQEQLDELVQASSAEVLTIFDPGQELLARLGKISRPKLLKARHQADMPVRKYKRRPLPEPALMPDISNGDHGRSASASSRVPAPTPEAPSINPVPAVAALLREHADKWLAH